MRLFVAINLPAEEKQRLSTILEELRKHDVPVRWVDADSLHITLKFLGEVPEPNAAEVGSAMREAAANRSCFQLRIADFGAFPSMSRPRVFWLGVEAPPQLAELQARVESRIAPLGFPSEKRLFSPHLTLGRVRNNAHIEPADADRFAGQVVYNAVVPVDSIELMRSHLSPRGARYEVLESVRLSK